MIGSNNKRSSGIRKHMKRLLSASLLLSALVPAVGLAQVSPPQPKINTFNDVTNILGTFMSWIFTILIFLAVIFVLYAAWLYLTAAGEPEKVSKANKTLLYAAIAVAVAILARSLPGLVGTIVGTSPGTTP